MKRTRNLLALLVGAMFATTAMATGEMPTPTPNPTSTPTVTATGTGTAASDQEQHQHQTVVPVQKVYANPEAEAKAIANPTAYGGAGGTAYGGKAYGGNVEGSGNSTINIQPGAFKAGEGGNSTATGTGYGGSAQGGSSTSTATNQGVQATGNTVNVGGDNVTYKFPANAPSAQFLPPLICGDKAGGAGFNNATFGFNFSFGGSRSECFETAEAAQCINGAIAIGAAFGKSLKIADAAIRCLAQMPTFKNAAKDAGQNPVEMAKTMVGSLETDYNLKAAHADELARERAKVTAAGNAVDVEKARIAELEEKLAAEKRRADRFAEGLEKARGENEKLAAKPKVIYRDRPAAKTGGGGKVKLTFEAECTSNCPPQK